MFTPQNMSHVKCHVSCVTRHVSCVMCHVSHVTCHIFFFFFFGRNGEAYRWRVCYQRGLPRLVFNGFPNQSIRWTNKVNQWSEVICHYNWSVSTVDKKGLFLTEWNLHCKRWQTHLKNIAKIVKSWKAAPRTYHRLLRCQVGFTKICHYYYCHYCYCCH